MPSTCKSMKWGNLTEQLGLGELLWIGGWERALRDAHVQAETWMIKRNQFYHNLGAEYPKSEQFEQSPSTPTPTPRHVWLRNQNSKKKPLSLALGCL